MEIKPGEMAKMVGVSVDTLHHYERMGVLKPSEKLDNGYRKYDETSIQRVTLIRRALRMGFSLSELASILAVRDQGEAPCKDVLALARKKLAALEVQVVDLTEMRDQLAILVDQWSDQLARTPPGQQARLLDDLPTPPATFKPENSRPPKWPRRSPS